VKLVRVRGRDNRNSLTAAVCGIEGFVEKRGSSVRILHYKGFMNGRRVYEKHSIAVSDSQHYGNK